MVHECRWRLMGEQGRTEVRAGRSVCERVAGHLPLAMGAYMDITQVLSPVLSRKHGQCRKVIDTSTCNFMEHALYMFDKQVTLQR